MEDIQNALNTLMRACSDANMPVFVAFQQSEHSVRAVTACEQLSSGDSFKLARKLLKAGSLDSFMKIVIADAQKSGHDSVFLKSVGVPTQPK